MNNTMKTGKAQGGTVNIAHADCLDFMCGLSIGSVDALITDPPYLVTDLAFDAALDFGWVDEARRVVQCNGYLVAFGLYEVQHEIRKRGWVRRFTGVWLKHKGGMRTHSAKMPTCQKEPFTVYAHPEHEVSELTYNKAYRDGEPYKCVMRNLGYLRGCKDQIDRARPWGWTEDGYTIENEGRREMTDVIFAPHKGGMPHAERTDHPTQKPVRLMSVIVEWLTNPGDLVLDPFMGSGSTGVAAVKLGRRFVGCDNQRRWVDVAAERIARAGVTATVAAGDTVEEVRPQQPLLF